MKKYLAILAFLFLTVSSCTTSPKNIEPPNYGPKPENYQEIVKEYYSKRLFDPSSAQYRFASEPSRGYLQGFGPKQWGWKVVVWINAKNRFGGYAGEQKHFVVIRNGEVVADHAVPRNLS